MTHCPPEVRKGQKQSNLFSSNILARVAPPLAGSTALGWKAMFMGGTKSNNGEDAACWQRSADDFCAQRFSSQPVQKPDRTAAVGDRRESQ